MPLEDASLNIDGAPPTMLDRVPPYSEEAEMGVLGSILLDYARSMDLCLHSQLDEEAFYLPNHKSIFDCMLKMYSAQKVIDLLTLSEYMASVPDKAPNRWKKEEEQPNGPSKLEAIGGPLLLEQLINSTPTVAHVEYYIGIVREKYMRRKIIACARKAENQCYTSPDSADQILGSAEQSFMDVTKDQNSTIMSWSDTVNHTMEQIEKTSRGDKAANGLPTGLKNLDKKFLGLRPAEMIIIAARPSQGKTSLVMNIAENIALGNVSDNKSRAVAMFSLEMSTASLAMRMLCCNARASAFMIAQGQHVSKEIHKRLCESASALRKAPIYIDDTGGLDVMEMRARARRMKQKYDIQLIIVDYLQLLNCKEYSHQGRQIETMAISSNIKSMAKELNIPVIALSQLSRASENRDKNSGGPKLSDLRDSGAIEQDADVVCMLRRPIRYKEEKYADYPNIAIVDVAKQRNGPTGEVYLHFEDQYTLFRDAENPHREQQLQEDMETGGYQQ
jgi:replicative DNA helicase